jgi:hypothetical protein
MYECIVAKLENVRPFPGADRIQLANCLGSQVIVGLEAKNNDIVLFFDTDGQLSEEYCKQNDLIGYTDEEGNKKGGYFDHKRRVKAQTFRKAKSEAYVASLDTVLYTGVSFDSLSIGVRFSELNGKLVCSKYYTPATLSAAKGGTQKTQAGYNKEALKKLFPEHFDTEQLRFARDEELIGLVTLTHKLHGTSARTGNIKFPVTTPLNIFKRAWNKYAELIDMIPFGPHLPSGCFFSPEVHVEYQLVYGTRRVVKGNANTVKRDDYRTLSAKKIAPAIEKGEIWYYEIVGYEDTGAAIMQTVSTAEMPKDFRKRFGDTITYKYGQLPGTCEVYVYRITHQNEDGVIYELPWAQVKDKCKKNGIKHVPEIHQLLTHEDTVVAVKTSVEYFTEEVDIADPLDESHPREGICIRIDNLENGKTKIFKNKTFAFKVLEGIAKADETSVDEEEMEALSE